MTGGTFLLQRFFHVGGTTEKMISRMSGGTMKMINSCVIEFQGGGVSDMREGNIS